MGRLIAFVMLFFLSYSTAEDMNCTVIQHANRSCTYTISEPSTCEHEWVDIKDTVLASMTRLKEEDPKRVERFTADSITVKDCPSFLKFTEDCTHKVQRTAICNVSDADHKSDDGRGSNLKDKFSDPNPKGDGLGDGPGSDPEEKWMDKVSSQIALAILILMIIGLMGCLLYICFIRKKEKPNNNSDSNTSISFESRAEEGLLDQTRGN